MKAERLILSFIAILIGLLVAGVTFYFYQSTKTLPPSQTQQLSKNVKPSLTPDVTNVLAIDAPKDESIVTKKTITVSGKTKPDATILVSSALGDEVVKPARNGNFTLTQSIEDGVNIVEITAIFPNGEQRVVRRTVTFSTEEF